MKISFWNFKNYTEQRWFTFLVSNLLIVVVFYIGAHWYVNSNYQYNYEYSRLSQEQMQLINRIYFDTTAKVTIPNNNKSNVNASKKTSTFVDSVKEKKLLDLAKLSQTDTSKKTENKPLPYKNTNQIKYNGETSAVTIIRAQKTIDYLQNEFNNKLSLSQRDSIKKFLYEATPFEATNFLGGTRFEVMSYFWLIGPSVYFEILLWALIGVLCSLLFNLGVIGKNSNTDLTDPQTSFDSSEIPYQVAKLLYAPACALVVILGYNYFKDQNIVDISSSKGVIVFAFISGFYSSRLVAFLDRLKDVLLPNSGTTELPGNKANTTPSQTNVLSQVIVQLQIDTLSLDADELAAIKSMGLNDAKVQIMGAKSSNIQEGTRMDTDPPDTFFFKNIVSGTYMLTATCIKTVAGAKILLIGETTGSIDRGKAPVVIILKKK